MSESSEREYIATKALLLHQHQTFLRNQTLSRYFGRGAFILIIGFMIVVNSSENWMNIAIFSTAVLVGVIWTLEAWTIRLAIQRLRFTLARREEGHYDHLWEDASIEFGYFRSYWIPFRLNLFIGMFEPLLWLCLVSYLFFLTRRGGL